MTSDETRVHSAMIADLLNPNGQHQMENVFLKLFIERLNGQTDHIVSFTCDNAKVECENISVLKQIRMEEDSTFTSPTG